MQNFQHDINFVTTHRLMYIANYRSTLIRYRLSACVLLHVFLLFFICLYWQDVHGEMGVEQEILVSVYVCFRLLWMVSHLHTVHTNDFWNIHLQFCCIVTSIVSLNDLGPIS